MNLSNKDTIITEILSIKNTDTEDFLNSKSINELIVIRYGKKMETDIQKRKNYENNLYDLDSSRFNRILMSSYNFNKIKELYNDFILNKVKRYELINKILEKIKKTDKLTKWSTKRLEEKWNAIVLKEKNDSIMVDLKKYGDGITISSTPIHVKKQRYNFLVLNGTLENNELRYSISKKTSQFLKKINKRPVYKTLMTKDILELVDELKMLHKKYHRIDLIKYLLQCSYNITFLNKQKLYVLEYLKSDLQPCEKGSRAELIRNLASKNIWSRNTIRNWDIDKLKNAYTKNIQDIYGPLSEYISNKPITKSEKERNKDKPQHPRLEKTREEILKDIAETIFFDLVS
jgi:hypothetical protein